MRHRTRTHSGCSDVPARLVVFACAASAGVHAGLVPEHLGTEPRLGAAFAVAVALLLTTGIAVTARPRDPRLARGSALLFAGLIAAYGASRTTGIPVLAPSPEPLDAVGMATNLAEALGLVAALSLNRRWGDVQPSRVQEVTQ